MQSYQLKNNLYFKVFSLCGGILLVFAILHFFSMGILKSSLAASYYKVNAGSTVSINQFGTCRRVTNNCSSAIFVPTNTSAEWSSFINNKPSCVSLANCAWVCPGSGGYIACNYAKVYSGSNCSGSMLGYRFCDDCSSDGSGTCYRVYGSLYWQNGYSVATIGSCPCTSCNNKFCNYEMAPYMAQCTWQ